MLHILVKFIKYNKSYRFAYPGPKKVQLNLEDPILSRETKQKSAKENIIELLKGIGFSMDMSANKVFLVPIPNCIETTLLNIIKEWILPGTTIMSNCWKSYDYLISDGFQHLKVNYSMNFVDQDTGKYTFKYI